jgi:hypothetical protein
MIARYGNAAVLFTDIGEQIAFITMVSAPEILTTGQVQPPL